MSCHVGCCDVVKCFLHTILVPGFYFDILWGVGFISGIQSVKYGFLKAWVNRLRPVNFGLVPVKSCCSSYQSGLLNFAAEN